MPEIGWNFDNSYARLPKSFFSILNPIPVRSPKVIILNETLATSLGLSVQNLTSNEGVQVFAGNDVPKDAYPLAQAYAGHQFGHFTMLGDGRAVLLGEHVTPKGERFDIQLKGSGRTPYSRGGDGRATLGPMLREYIISEAMHALGIPTTRSLAVVTTGESVYRESELPGAILTRVAASHIRVGTFQYAATFGKEKEDVRALADYTIKRHFPMIADSSNCYLSLLQEVIKRQADLIAKWQLVGFIHGVMNTDNMAICGETIDYGPCAFMDVYDPATVFSSIDRQGRYAYGNQPYIGGWNLARFAETLLPLLSDNKDKAIELAQETLATFSQLFKENWLRGMRAKLGLMTEGDKDLEMVEGLLRLMQDYQADFTNTFRALTLDELDDSRIFQSSEFSQWYQLWNERKKREGHTKEAIQELMQMSNPSVIPRNHRVEEALAQAVENGDFTVMERLLKIVSKPFAYSSEQNEYCKLADPASLPYRTFCGT